MKYVDVRLRQPDWMLHPMQEFIRTEDAVRYEELLTWNVVPDEGLEYELFYVEADRERYRAALAGVESIREYRIAPIDDESIHVWACQETRPEDRAWRAAFADRQLVVVPPVRFDDEAAMRMTIVGDGGDVQGVLEELPADVEVTVVEVGTYDRRGATMAGALTDRQREAVRAALELGYYDVPRGAALADVASALECAESSASMLLRRAERELMRRVVDRHGGTDRRPERVEATPSAGSDGFE
ncbi:helix-turn-helix domain-containing protein [Natrarchaeobius oligotrophus]|uniref:Bacterio-opsin activator n=1 Tax=Natrarchaeobius chitinivorans TaxID=1679083 RepID=A0A3N6MNU1_NATCH|nr:helix-turn-helix domain-containing protein [Natrarchaeobius chitinivorans]RQH03355.1 bacterio-opsin activator [Natrarchaeobius chitinivorans]